MPITEGTLRVQDVMTPTVVSIRPSDTVESAARVMARFGVSSLVVQSEGELVGILTEKDVLTRVVASGRNPREVTVGEVMTGSVIVTDPDVPLEEASETMLRNRIKKLPVVEAEDHSRLVGMLSLTDIANLQPRMLERVRKLSHQALNEVQDDEDFASLCHMGEGQRLEFKSSFRFDHNRKCVNNDLELVCLKTICAFLNAEGGDLLIGVSDDGMIVGLAADYQGLKTKNRDGLENYLISQISQKIGDVYLKHVRIFFQEIDGEEICRVSVTPSQEPAYITHKSKQEFFVRTGNNSRPFKISDAAKYLKERWR